MKEKALQKSITLKDQGLFWGHLDIKDAEYYRDGDLYTLDIPDRLILPSEYQDWHCVLNNGPIVPDNTQFDKVYDELCLPENRELLIKSRDNCLGTIQDGKVIGNPLFHTANAQWQCVFPYILKSFIKNIKEDWVGSNSEVIIV